MTSRRQFLKLVVAAGAAACIPMPMRLGEVPAAPLEFVHHKFATPEIMDALTREIAARWEYHAIFGEAPPEGTALTSPQDPRLLSHATGGRLRPGDTRGKNTPPLFEEIIPGVRIEGFRKHVLEK